MISASFSRLQQPRATFISCTRGSLAFLGLRAARSPQTWATPAFFPGPRRPATSTRIISVEPHPSKIRSDEIPCSVAIRAISKSLLTG